jgi:hypothetical protein
MRLDELNLYELGNTIGISGMVLSGNDWSYLCMFPDQEAPANQWLEKLELTYEDWQKLVFQLDNQEVEVLQKTAHGDLAKVVLRKSQRLIEQRVSWAVFKRDNYTCRYCGADDVPLTVDHLILWEEMGPSVEANLVAACRKCNKTRGNMQYEEWLNSPYYAKVSVGLSPEGRAANWEILKNNSLAAIPLRKAERATRK